MKLNRIVAVCTLFVFVLAFSNMLVAQTDANNMGWVLSWMGPLADKAGTNEIVEGSGIPVPYRGHCAGAWYDMDGDGNLEFFHDDNNYQRDYVFENAGDDNYEFRWFTDFVNAEGGNLYTGERGVTATDLDGNGTDELLVIRSTPGPGADNHIPPIRVFAHEDGSDEFLPEDWTVDWDECPTGREDGQLWMEYYNNAGDWDNDGNGEFGMNYKNDPLYYFAIIEVSGNLVPGEVQFTVEALVDRATYGMENNVAEIVPYDIDGDDYDELYLPNRNVATQEIVYMDCTGEDQWTTYYWGNDDTWIVPSDTIAYGNEYNFCDLDKDGDVELISLAQDKGVNANNARWLWVTDLNAQDPANLMTADSWHRVKLVTDMLGVEQVGISLDICEPGDADGDGYPDIYFNVGNQVQLGGIIMDAEFVGDDYTDPADWNYYKIIECAKMAGLDTTFDIHGSMGRYGDGDKDGKADLWHNNRRDAALRPAEYIWEYTGSPEPQDDATNMGWVLSWMGPLADKAGTNEIVEGSGIPVPYRGHCAGAWYDMDGDGNLEFFHDDNNYQRDYVFENAGNDNYEFRWFTDFVNAEGGNLYTGERGVTATDLDGNGTDELLVIRSTPGPGADNHIPPIRVFAHEDGSDEFLPEDWTVDWDECPTGREDGQLWMEYYNNAGDWDNDGNGEFGMNYKNDPLYYFAIIEVSGNLVPGEVQFTVEALVDRATYGMENNVAEIVPYDIDGDGYDELYLPNRNVATQEIVYMDCTGEDQWTTYYWGNDDTWIVPSDTIAYGNEYNFCDLDKDGDVELISLAQDKGVNANNARWLWVTDLNAQDPANLMTAASWHRVKSVTDMLGVEQVGISLDICQPGDADGDGYPDIYFNVGNQVQLGGIIMDAEFIGTDYTNPTHWNYYKIVECAKMAGLDTTFDIHGSMGKYGDGDKDGKADLWHNNRRDAALRPAEYIWEYDYNGVESFETNKAQLPVAIELAQNYPNPFNPTTTIAYTLKNRDNVEVKVYDINGRLVNTLFSGVKVAGSHQVVWNGTDINGYRVASGVYFYAVSTNQTQVVKKMVLTK